MLIAVLKTSPLLAIAVVEGLLLTLLVLGTVTIVIIVAVNIP